MKMFGGPLDGETYDGEVDPLKPYIVFPAYWNDELKEPFMLCMYHYHRGILEYVSSMTKEQLRSEYGKS